MGAWPVTRTAQDGVGADTGEPSQGGLGSNGRGAVGVPGNGAGEGTVGVPVALAGTAKNGAATGSTVEPNAVDKAVSEAGRSPLEDDPTDPESTVRVPMQRFRLRLAGGRGPGDGATADASANGAVTGPIVLPLPPGGLADLGLPAEPPPASAFVPAGTSPRPRAEPPAPAQRPATGPTPPAPPVAGQPAPAQPPRTVEPDQRPADTRTGGEAEFATATADALSRRDPYRANVAWERSYSRWVVLADLAACLLATGLAYVIRFGGFVEFETQPESTRPYLLMTVLLPLAWIATMSLNRAYESRFLGGGSEEFRRVVNAAVRLVALVAVVSYATKAEVARAYLLIAFPTATVLTLIGRASARGALHRLRRAGRCMHRVLVVGAGESAAAFVRLARRDPSAGWSVVGICLDRAPGKHSRDRPERAGFDLFGVPIVGTSDNLQDAIRLTDATTVAISPQIDGEQLRRLLWALEGSNVDVLVSSAVTDVTGPRIHLRPVAGLPLLHIEEPELTGARRMMKAALDRGLALTVVLLAFPVFMALGLAVRLTSRGPAIFKQVRVGQNGKEFRMYKFRSMYVDAEERKAELEAKNESAGGVLFKMKNDPRVTPVGRFLRKWSLDELPQLFNVLNGTMSLVGPRPPLPSEVARYERDVHRRLMVKPGLTGLWQISGRSDLDWDESVRLDLRYVENWSLAMDLVILWRTVFAVLRREGAY
ncbi:MAG: exopolysaccharide biosynthesis polyprenyl glycosylphosphotransferase [Frankia sp.]|nr:exopolysaccharide biosynthesis polyprenyl glycosylphosphotransferase [Frankia sp.]